MEDIEINNQTLFMIMGRMLAMDWKQWAKDSFI
jgi:hypothetical protein